MPLEATPPFFGWFAEISPFRHIIDGARSLLYFDGDLTAGLRSAWISVALGGVLGFVLGLGVTTAYGRVHAFSRHPRPDPVATTGHRPLNQSDIKENR